VARRGFTLVELMVALALALIVSAAAQRLLLTTQRLSRIQAARIAMQSNARTSAFVITSELRELGGLETGSADQNDILSLSSSGLTYRAMRGVGFLCEAPAGGQIRIARAGFSGLRDPEPARDGGYLFLEGDPSTDADDRWIQIPITAVSTTSACAGTGQPAITISSPNSAVLAGAPPGTPLRIYEVMELRLYQSDTRWWLGARSMSAGETIQPVSGPFAGAAGLHFDYLNQAGAVTSQGSATKSAVIRLRVISDAASSPTANELAPEELLAQVTLRNASGH
jgi:prepilin-type N-terminal cleavage/methylation domain-containing protein